MVSLSSRFRILCILQVLSDVLDDVLGVRIPDSLCGEGLVWEDVEGVQLSLYHP